MDRYVKGLLTAYDRVLNLIEAIDPDHIDTSLECLRVRIDASLVAYKLFLTKEDIDGYESEKLNKLKALEGVITMEDIDKSIEQINEPTIRCKILSLPDNYFMHNSSHPN